MRWWSRSWGIYSEFPETRGSLSSWTAWGATWQCWIDLIMRSQRFFIEFRSRVCVGLSIVSIPSSSRNCLRSLVPWAQSISCTSKASSQGSVIHPVQGLCVPMWMYLPRSSLTHHQSDHTKQCCRQQDSSPFHVCRLSWEPVLICKKNTGRQCQTNHLWCSLSDATVPGSEHRAHYRGHRALLHVPSWWSWTTCATSVGHLMLPLVTLNPDKCKTCEKQ